MTDAFSNTDAFSGSVLVTGAAGFIGSHAARHLAQHSAWSVVGSTRDGRHGTRRLDLLDPASAGEALSGVGAVVHCAVGDRSATVDGTRNLLAAAAKAGVRRFVHFSTMSVYRGSDGVVTENAPLVPAEQDDYAGWKVASEEACLAQDGLEVVRLRPTIVYGPGSRQWVSWPVTRIRSGRWGTFGPAGEGTCNLVHVTDVCAAVAAALASKEGAGQAFNVNGPELITWNEWFARLAKIAGRSRLPELSARDVRMRNLAAIPLKALAKSPLKLRSDRLLGVPSRGEMALYGSHAVYSNERAQSRLGWSPRLSVSDGLADTAEWLKQEKLTD